MRLRTHLLVFLFYLGVTLLITYPLITVFSTRMIGHPFGDEYEYTHHVWWIKTALQTGQNPFFMPNLVYPDGVSAALLWSLPLQSFPAWLFYFVMSLPAAFNLAALLTLALNGWAMFFLCQNLLPVGAQHAAPLPESTPDANRSDGFHLAKQDTRPYTASVSAAALLAGLAFMLYPAFQGQLGAAHTGLLTLWPAPLFLLMLLRLRDVTRPRRTILAGAVLFAASLWGSVLLLIYLLAPIMALYLLILIRARDGRALRCAFTTVLLGAVFALPFVVPLALDTLRQPPESGAVTYSASLLGVAAPSFYHPLFSGWDYNRRVLGTDPFEQASYVGLVAAALAALAVWKIPRARPWLWMALAAWVFSLGPLLKVYDAPLTIRIDGYATQITLPWALFQNLPLVSIARTPARFSFAVGFGVALLAGFGAAYLLARIRRNTVRWALLAALLLLIGFDDQFWWPLPTNAGTVPEPIAALAQNLAQRDGDVRAVLDIPWYHPLVNKDGMFLQTGHGLPMIIGQVARRSPVSPAKANLLQDTLDPALLDAAGVDIVILHKAYDGSEGEYGALARAKLGTPVYEDDQYAVFEVPEYHGDPPGFTSASDGATLYFYAPQPGAAVLTGQAEASGHAVTAALDGVPLAEWTADGAQALNMPVTFGAGYHTLTVSLSLPCPETITDPALACPALAVTGLNLEDYQAIGGA